MAIRVLVLSTDPKSPLHPSSKLSLHSKWISVWLSDRPLQKKEQLCFPTKHTKVGRSFDWSLLHCSDKGGSPGSYTRTTLGFIHSLCNSVTATIGACYTFCRQPHFTNIYKLALLFPFPLEFDEEGSQLFIGWCNRIAKFRLKTNSLRI